MAPSKLHKNKLPAEVFQWADKAAPVGTVVGTSDAQTLTNKSIDAGQLTGSVPDARLSANVPLKNATNVFTDDLTIAKAGSGIVGPKLVLSNTGASLNDKAAISFMFANSERASLIMDVNASPFGADLIYSAGSSGSVTERFRVDQFGLLVIKGQIKFPATANPSTDANTLDDYEEGSYTPTCSTAGGTITSVVATGRYTKIGRSVQWNAVLNITNNGTGSAWVYSSLPFNVGHYFSGCGMQVGQNYSLLVKGEAVGGTQILIFKHDTSYPLSGGSGSIVVDGKYDIA